MFDIVDSSKSLASPAKANRMAHNISVKKNINQAHFSSSNHPNAIHLSHTQTQTLVSSG